MNKISHKRIPEGQEHLPFRAKGTRGVLAYVAPLERRALALACAVFVALCVTYVYFLMSSVHVVAERQDIGREQVKLSAHVADLEAAYFNRTEIITEEYAYATGFSSPTHRSFVERTRVVTLDQ